MHAFVQLGIEDGFPGDGEVVVIDTDSRELAREEAYRSMHAICLSLRESKPSCIYKKIDSTLRGNWGAEVAAAEPLVAQAQALAEADVRGSSSSWSPNSGERYSYSRDYGRSGGGLDLGSLLLGGLLLGGGHNYGGWSSHHHDSDWGGGGGFFSGGGDFSGGGGGFFDGGGDF